MHRREFLGMSLAGWALAATRRAPQPLFRISLAEWSFHRALRSGAMEHLDFARTAREDFGLEAVEYVNAFFFERARDAGYLREMRARAEDQGVRSLLIMCDNEGALGAPLEADRRTTIDNHRKWVGAAKALGCHSIRVNARSDATLGLDEQQKLAADGLRRLCEIAEGHEIYVLVENHGGPSSNGLWLSGLMKLVDHPRVGTLPDFGNFLVRRDPEEWYDRYEGVRALMPYAKAVSAKSYDFDAEGKETRTDYRKMMRIVLDAGYRGFVGIEFEGDGVGETEGVGLTRDLLVKVGKELAPLYA